MRWTWDTQDLWIDPARLIATGRSVKFVGTAGDDKITGTDGRDQFDLRQGGEDVVRGKAGDDTFQFFNAFTINDFVNGGAGHDKIFIGGSYSSVIEFSPERIKGVEKLEFSGQALYKILIDDGFDDLRIVSKLAQLNVNASNLASGAVNVFGGGFADNLVGGLGDDVLQGNGNADVLTGGEGRDRFLYHAQVDSTDRFGNHPDTITDFSLEDAIDLPKLDGGYHVGITDEHVGDVVAMFDTEKDVTVLSIFLDADDIADMKIFLSGDCHDIMVTHQSRVELI